MRRGLKFFLVALILSLPLLWGINIFQENLENYFYAQISEPFQQIVELKIPEKPKLDLQVKSAISVKISEANRKKILFQKNISQPLPIASLTKLMTAIIVLEDGNYDLKNTWVTISEKAANQENVPNYGNLDSEKGKKFSLKQLLDLMLVYSSNDAAWALSEVIGVDEFVEKMNQKAEILGLENTHFVNPTGLDPEGLKFNPENLNYFNYSTAKDLAKLAQYILKEHRLIFEISRKEPLYKLGDGIFNLFLTEEVIGGKTGYTEEAGGCMVFLFQDESGGLVFINVILGAQSAEARIEEMQKLIDWLNL